MTVQESYLYFTNAVNKLSSNSGLNIPKQVFVSTFNAVQSQWVEDRVKMNELNKIRMDEIQQLMVSSKLNVKKEEQYYTVDLPANYYHYLRSYSYVGDCTIDSFITSITKSAEGRRVRSEIEPKFFSSLAR